MDYHEKLFLEEFNENKALQNYLEKNNFFFEKLINEGKSSWIFTALKNEKRFTFKLEKKRSTRSNMVERERKYLQILNKHNMAPKYIDSNKDIAFVVYEYFDAITLEDYLEKAKKQDLKKIIKELIGKAKKLDEIGVDHGQLAGKGTNILIKDNRKTIIVDFEKASNKRKVHNYNVMKFFLLGDKSLMAAKIKKILGKDFDDLQKKL